MTMADITESLFQTIDIISKKQLNSLSFDTTIEATVIDASRAQDGIYTVSTGNSNFLAYAVETGYKKDDAVMVTVPQGDYNKQKMIIGKQVDNTNTPMIYKSPFQQLINVSNNLISGEHEISLWANAGKDYGWNEDIANFWESDAFKEFTTKTKININDSDDDNVSQTSETYSFKKALIWDSKDLSPTGEEMFESRYTRLGIKAQFSTWLNEYNTTQGNYGLAIVLIFSNNDYDDSSNSTGRFGKVITFDSSEFFGDVYNFETYYTQEALFDISEFVDYPIRQIQLYAYQRNNFKNADGELIYPIGDIDSEEGWFSNTQPNIFIKDPYICLGMPTSEFNTDMAMIISGSSSTYYKLTSSGENNVDTQQRTENNLKELQLRWIHKNAEDGTIATVQANEIPKNYSIYWYRYKLGARSPDEFAGAHWERFYGCKATPDENEEYCITQEDIDSGKAEDITTNQVEVLFYPNINKQSEQLKAIIIKEESSFDLSSTEPTKRMITATPIIEFTNQTDVRNQATVIDENALSIKFEDEEKGNYFLYDRAGNIAKEEDKEIRVLTAVFDLKQSDVYKKPPLTQPYTSIKWIFPASNSMIIPATTQDTNAIPLNNVENLSSLYSERTDHEVKYNSDTDSYEFLFTQKDDEKQDAEIISVGYFINPYLNHNANRNIVYLEINKDGQLYTAQAQMFFGTAGSSGSDYTIIVIWDNGENAFDINKGQLSGQVYLFDQTGRIVDIDENSQYNFSWYKTKTYGLSSNDRNSIKESNENLYYPIKNQKLQKLINLNGDSDNDFIDVNYFANENNESYNKRNVVKYNLKNKKFEELTNDDNNLSNQILYSTAKETSFNRQKLSFIPIDEVIIDDSLKGYIGTDSQTHKRVYYYSNIRRAFVKYNDIYIIDPWDEYQESEIYYEPIYSFEKDYSSDTNLRIFANSDIKGHFSIKREDIDDLEYRKNIIDNELYILQVTLTNFGDYDLIARFPIPIKNSDPKHNGENENKNYTVDFIEGPTDVRYSTTGETDFNKNPYSIQFKILKKEQDKSLTYEKFTEKTKINNVNNIGHWELIYESNNENDTFLPCLIEHDKQNNFINPLLQPPGMYFEDTPLYGVKYILDYNILFNKNDELGTITIEYSAGNIIESGQNAETRDYIKKGTTLWSQPIYSYQDNYPSTTLNKWNGKDIITEEETGIITANGFSAGKKEKDNTFTGVILGDWSRSNTDSMITKQTGIYGFNHGAMSYALKDDGTAFFGKDGKGRIYFNGNNAQIYSAEWTAPKYNNENNLYTQKHQGMMLDINDGIIDIRGQNDRTTYLKPGLFKLTGQNPITENSQTLIEISDSKYILQSANFEKREIYTPQGYIDGRGLQINLNNGKIQGYDFTLIAGTKGTYNQQIIINTEDQNYPFKIGDNFKINWDGKLFASEAQVKGEIKADSGYIGNWILDDKELKNNSGSIGLTSNLIYAGRQSNGTHNFQVNTSGQLIAKTGRIGDWELINGRLQNTTGTVYLSPLKISLSDNFYVTSDGSLYATRGSIGGWNINGSSLYSGNVYLNSNGTISGGTISGGTISGGTITGNISATNGVISGGTISGGEIKIPGTNTKFHVTSAGDVTIGGSLSLGTHTNDYSSVHISSANHGLVEAATINANYFNGGIYTGEVNVPLGGGYVSISDMVSNIFSATPSGGHQLSSYLLDEDVIPNTLTLSDLTISGHEKLKLYFNYSDVPTGTYAIGIIKMNGYYLLGLDGMSY